MVAITVDEDMTCTLIYFKFVSTMISSIHHPAIEGACKVNVISRPRMNVKAIPTGVRVPLGVRNGLFGIQYTA